MEIKIDNESIGQAIAGIVGESLEEGVRAWDAKQAMTQAVKEAVLKAGMPALIRDELDARLSEHASEIVKKIVDDAMPSFVSVFKKSINMHLAQMLWGLHQGGPQYMTSRERERWRGFLASIEGVSADDDLSHDAEAGG